MNTAKPLKIAVASGKGGTGKTTVATCLAAAICSESQRVAYLDCDVEEPNGHIFLKPAFQQQSQVTIPVPQVDEQHCNYCRKCSQLCNYSAIVVLKHKLITMPKLCHGCGGCSLVCPENAIREIPRSIGIIEEGKCGQMICIHGRMHIGEAMAPPIIRAVHAAADELRGLHTIVIDSPPGTSCPVIESVKAADVVLLVSEPTPFGLHDLQLAVGMVRALGIPFGVAVNRVGIGDRKLFDYCKAETIPILFELEDDRQIAESYSRGDLIVDAFPFLKKRFVDLAAKLSTLADRPRPKPSNHEDFTPQTYQRHTLPSEISQPDEGRDIKELVVISGKGGTGKTSVTAAFCTLADSGVLVDCDVDAADLHLVMSPKIQKCWPFSGGYQAAIDPLACTGCGNCQEQCRFHAIEVDDPKDQEIFRVNPISCEGCGVCACVCPSDAVKLSETINGEWYVSDTRYGTMVHARLGIAQENSGKLVSLVRREARAIAAFQNRKMLLVDGSPGIGCPVIASITGADLVLIVTEPTLSGMHDMMRVAELASHFKVKAFVCINKSDINSAISNQLQQQAEELGLGVLGTIRYDPQVTHAQVQGKSVIEIGDSAASQDMQALWKRVKKEIGL